MLPDYALSPAHPVEKAFIAAHKVYFRKRLYEKDLDPYDALSEALSYRLNRRNRFGSFLQQHDNHPIALFADSPFEAAIIDCIQVFHERNQKYANVSERSPWYGAFVATAREARLLGMDNIGPVEAALVLLAVKRARQVTGDGKDHPDDTVSDSKRDECNYLAIALALFYTGIDIDSPLAGEEDQP